MGPGACRRGPRAGPLVPAAAIALVETALGDYHALHAVRADLLRRLDRPEEARAAYARALDLATNPAERAFLARRQAEVG